MIESFVRPESWITEVLRINSHIGGITELEFGYSPLSEMLCQRKAKRMGEKTLTPKRSKINTVYPGMASHSRWNYLQKGGNEYGN